MKLSSFLVGLSVLGRTVLSHPMDLPFKLGQEELERLEKRAGVIGTTGLSGKATRLEIRQLAQHANQFTLFLLAMQQFQAQSQTDSTGYYQIAGIHGVPRQSYNGVAECSTCSGADGYCTHDSVLFPAWHRVYLALFEQELISVANSIANSWPTSGTAQTRAQMQAAAQTLRLPYWDWAAIPPNGGNMLPQEMSAAKVTINGPNGKETIANPLYQHSFSSPSSLVYTPFKSWQNTLRWPTSDASDATSNESGCISGLNSARASLQDQVYQLLITCTDYLHFSNDHAGSSTTSCSNSLEGIHNTIHTTTGGVPSTTVKTVGHMYYLSEAAFDPAFWMHHANVDRLFAMWQTLHPSSYGASQVAPHNTWTIAQGTTQDQNSPLTPFYKSSSGGAFWTTSEVKDWTQFGYTYPEFADSNGSKKAIAKYAKALYGPSATATAGSSKRTAAPEPVAETEKRGLFGSPFSGVGKNSPFLAPNGSTYEYVANIVAPRYALNGSYYIFTFLGKPDSEDPSTWLTDSNLIGPMGVLSQANMQSKDVLIAGSIPLTRALTSKLGTGPLAQLTEMLVAPFLKDMLEWRILGPDGSCIDPDNVPGFKISVYATTASQPEEDCLPEYSDFIPLPEVTHGRPGGLSFGSLRGGHH